LNNLIDLTNKGILSTEEVTTMNVRNYK
jgi:hypothetical protein